MDNKFAHMFYIVLIIFHFSFLLVKCENVSVAIPAEMPKTSTELMTEPIGGTMVKLDTKQLSQQARFISVLRSVRSSFETVVFWVKGLAKSYSWYAPELKLGGCVIKYTRTLYPELMQMRLSYENVSTFLRSLYFAIYGYITQMINENRQDTESEHDRIGIKVAEMTLHDVSSSFSPPSTILSTESSSSGISSSRPINHVKSSLYNYEDGNFNYVQKFRPVFPNHRDANHLNPKFSIPPNYKNELKVAESFNDFSPRTRSMDILKFNKNIFPTNSINANEYDENKSFSLESEVPFHSEKFETKHSDNNYNVPAAEILDSSPSSSSVILSKANIFDLPETDKIGKFSNTLAKVENNLNVKETHKRDGNPNKFSVMYVGPRQFPTDYQYDMSPSSDDTPTLELTKNDDKKGAVHDEFNIFNIDNIIRNIFDFDTVILESFGFNAKTVKSSTLGRCARSYLMSFSTRAFEYLFLR